VACIHYCDDWQTRQNCEIIRSHAQYPVITSGPKMAEITIPRTGAHLRKLFEILTTYPDGLQAADALNKLASVVNMTPYEAGVYESTGSRRFERIVRFATVDCVKAGWLLKNKGVWSVTDTGKKAFNEFPNPEEFYREAIRLYRAWRVSTTDAQEAESLEELSPSPASLRSESSPAKAGNGKSRRPRVL
jgi:Mrr N-terminal domain